MSKPRHEYIYGLNPAFEVIRGGRRAVHGAWLNKAASGSSRIKKLAALLERKAIDIEWADKRRIFDFAQSKEHQGVVLRTSPYAYIPFDEVLGRPRLLLLDNVEDPHNTGALLRCADCFGFPSVLLPTRGTPEGAIGLESESVAVTPPTPTDVKKVVPGVPVPLN